MTLQAAETLTSVQIQMPGFVVEQFLSLIHIFNDWLPQQENVVQIVAAVTIAVVLAWVIHMLFDLLWKAAAALSGR